MVGLPPPPAGMAVPGRRQGAAAASAHPLSDVGSDDGFARLFKSAVADSAYSGDGARTLVEALRKSEGGGKAVVETLAGAVAAIIGPIAYDGMKKGAPVTPGLVAEATAELSADFGTELLQAAGMERLTDEQVQAVYLRAVEILKGEKERIMADMSALSAGNAADAAMSPRPGGLPAGGPGLPARAM